MKPVIGITCSYSWDREVYLIRENYVEAVVRSGGIPIILPATENADINKIISMIDGLLLSGGGDIDPYIYGEAPTPRLGRVDPVRDLFEIGLAKKAFEMEKPTLAICRGIQVLNVAAGGTLFQDLSSQLKNTIKHRWYSQGGYDAPPSHPAHLVRISKDSKLYKIFGREILRVNSFHHQAVKRIGEKFKATAWAEDGVIEAIEYLGDTFILGVQWHPERMINGEMIKLFKAFIEAAKS
ncbi:MAG: gamma-glutamyl-gamma-aminobutyrate hydrolase family protein [Candidatus Methanomethylicota archaeon]|nr:MAG: gamma-glutamyl-gamma-aminobutyrate hydrolase family protein [Candidatus Verstraetearchaeota archaeon]